MADNPKLTFTWPWYGRALFAVSCVLLRARCDRAAFALVRWSQKTMYGEIQIRDARSITRTRTSVKVEL